MLIRLSWLLNDLISVLGISVLPLFPSLFMSSFVFSRTQSPNLVGGNVKAGSDFGVLVSGLGGIVVFGCSRRSGIGGPRCLAMFGGITGGSGQGVLIICRSTEVFIFSAEAGALPGPNERWSRLSVVEPRVLPS